MRVPALALTAALLTAALAGCLQDSATVDPAAQAAKTAFDTTRGWSMPLSPALYELLEPVKEFVPSFDGTPISVALFFPKIEGCDWSAASVPDSCKLPVVMDAGPYYAGIIDQVKYRPPTIEWLVPRGYVVAHMSIRGTGESGGCMELFSENEQKDVSEVVTWLGTQPWSTGSVGMIGRSYDGTTPLMAAGQGNPYLKTIVPISSVPSLRDLMFRNGTSEERGPIFHSVVYWANYGLGAGDGGLPGHRQGHAQEQVCEDAVQGAVQGPLAMATGDVSDAYWEERDLRQKVLDNYNGSIWIIHGFEDWNVNPSQVVPWFNELQDKGLRVKMWMGVWGHAYPDRVDEHRNVRWDWAEWVVRWFDSELKGLDVDTGPVVEVEDSLFVWRAEESYPPRDANWMELELGDGVLVPKGNASGASEMPLAADGTLSWTSEPLAQDMRIAGLPQIHVTVSPTTPVGGYLFAELHDVFPDGRTMRIGWAPIDLRYHAGGNTEPATLVPGQPVLAKMEAEPMDAHLGEGHRLRLVLHKNGVEDVRESPSKELLLIGVGGGLSVLRLPVIDRPDVLPTYNPPGLEE
ncbi:MAG TPA: CocE/NonD family hydrolase [Candidatus Thermoplasmatota archaeon]|nr:CocE/NonD family hydrolase [Candidatus Thermoplasmatota archaeon]